MDNKQVASRLQAWFDGRPLPNGSTRSFRISEDSLVIALVRMGGESTPWGISVGSPHSKPELFTVADPREPQARARMIGEFANYLLKYFCHPRLNASESALQAGGPIKQLWIPDPSHLDLLHQIAYGYAFANGPLDDMADLNDLGRLLNCLFIQWQHPGQQMVMIISDCLRSMYTFPASPVRQHHLGFLTAWLADDRTRTERLANATEAEETSISTTIDGAIERKLLNPLLERFTKTGRTDEVVGREIRNIIEHQLNDRWNTAVNGLRSITTDKREENPGVTTLAGISANSWNQLWVRNVNFERKGQQTFWPALETDKSPTSAAISANKRALAATQSKEALAHGDQELAMDLINSGHGMVCEVNQSLKTEGDLKHFTVEYSIPSNLDVRIGTSFCPFGQQDIELTVLENDPAKHIVRLEGKSNFKVGEQLLLLEHTPDFLIEGKNRYIGLKGSPLNDLIISISNTSAKNGSI